MRSTVFLPVLALALPNAGCTKHPTNVELEAKVQPIVDGALASYAAVESGLASWPAPEPGGTCTHLGLIPTPPAQAGHPIKAEERFGPPGESDTELVDAEHIPDVPPLRWHNGLFRTGGIFNTTVTRGRFLKRDKLHPTFHIPDGPGFLAPYELSAKVRYLIVTRPNRYEGIADRVDIFLFDRMKSALECSFAVDTGSVLEQTRRTGYDPYTGETTTSATAAGLKPAFARALVERFGITLPPEEKVTIPASDDPAVHARGVAVTKALDAAPENLAGCSASDLADGVRMSKKALRIVARENLLDSNDRTVLTDPNGSSAAQRYLRTRDSESAAVLASAPKWRVVEILSGGPALMADQKSFVEGGVTGREVVFDASNHAVCQRPFAVRAQRTMDAKVRKGPGGISSDIGERSAVDLRKRIDETIGDPR